MKVNYKTTPPSISTYKFLQALGHLFYAVAAADKVVAPKEASILKQIIDKYWLPLFHQNEAVSIIQITFDKLLKQEVPSKVAYSKFVEYKHNNSLSFNDKRKKNIWTTVNSIAEAINGKNKSELLLLVKLDVLLKE